MKPVIQLENSINEKILLDSDASVELYIKREDKIHPKVSGNKYRKLKYNLEAAKRQGLDTLLTFGGAFSNHIAALASAGEAHRFQTIGVIRGEELEAEIDVNPTLKFARASGMHLKFVSRDAYKNKTTEVFLNALKKEFGEFYLIPEGGTNALAVKGCEEILTKDDYQFEYICACVGTGGTLSGLINSSKTHQKVIGFPALKGNFLDDEIRKFVQQENWELILDYHFGGYAKINTALITFINQFKTAHHIQLDPIYTSKMLFGVLDLIAKNYFKKNTKILVIHTGGLQGISGMNLALKKKQLPLINYNENH